MKQLPLDVLKKIANWRPAYIEAIEHEFQTRPVERFIEISEQEWMRHKGCGRKFLALLHQHGWVLPYPKIYLSTAAQTALQQAEVEENKQAVETAIRLGRLIPNRDSPRYYGLKAYNELRQFAGLDRVAHLPKRTIATNRTDHKISDRFRKAPVVAVIAASHVVIEALIRAANMVRDVTMEWEFVDGKAEVHSFDDQAECREALNEAMPTITYPAAP